MNMGTDTDANPTSIDRSEKRQFTLPPRRWPLAFAFVVAALAALWISAVDVAQEQRPDLALTISPHHARALQSAIDREIRANAERDMSSNGTAGMALSALKRDATSVVAVRSLALLAADRGDPAGADRLMRLGERLSRRDIPTQFYLIQRAVDGGLVDEALSHFDVALRVNRSAREVLYPILASAIRDAPVNSSFAELLERDPPWAAEFALYASARPSSLPAVARALASAARSPVSANPEVRRAILTHLARLGAWPEARSFYRAIGGRALADMNFAYATMPPFEWTWADTSEIEAAPDAHGQLAYRLSPNVGGILGERVALLAPGRYRLALAARGSGDDRQAGPSIELRCLGDSANILVRQAVARNGATSDMAFVVPPACPAQNIRLSASATESPAGQEGFLSGFSIRRR